MAAKIRANRRKLRDELIIHRQKMLFYNKKIVLPTPICKINQLIRDFSLSNGHLTSPG